jgi:hypothetical protein
MIDLTQVSRHGLGLFSKSVNSALALLRAAVPLGDLARNGELLETLSYGEGGFYITRSLNGFLLTRLVPWTAQGNEPSPQRFLAHQVQCNWLRIF